MLIVIENVLSRETALALREDLLAADWVDGNITSGAGAALAKKNRQLPEECPAALSAQEKLIAALSGNAAFLSAALPHTIIPPLFNRYGVGDGFGAHVDNAIRVHAPTGTRLRTDVSSTLFLTDPDDYDGGELIVEGAFGSASYKLNAGDMLVYPSSSLHRVTEVTRGERVGAFFWTQSLVADAAEREMLFNLDQSVQALTAKRGGEDSEVLRLTAIYHNLVRKWAVN